MLVRAGFGYMVNSDRILAVMPFGTNWMRNFLKERQEARAIIVNACGATKCRGVILLDNGTVIKTGRLPETLQEWVLHPGRKGREPKAASNLVATKKFQSERGKQNMAKRWHGEEPGPE